MMRPTERLRRWWQNRTAAATIREIDRDPYFGRDYARPTGTNTRRRGRTMLKDRAMEAIADYLKATDGTDYERQASDILDMLGDMGIALTDMR